MESPTSCLHSRSHAIHGILGILLFKWTSSTSSTSSPKKVSTVLLGSSSAVGFLLKCYQLRCYPFPLALCKTLWTFSCRSAVIVPECSLKSVSSKKKKNLSLPLAQWLSVANVHKIRRILYQTYRFLSPHSSDSESPVLSRGPKIYFICR